jgi:serine/threonine protein kinase/ankyrin repeat protein
MNEELFVQLSTSEFAVRDAFVDYATLQAALDDSFMTFDLLVVAEIAKVERVFGAQLSSLLQAHGSASNQLAAARQLLRCAQLNVAALVSLAVERFDTGVFDELGAMLADAEFLDCKRLIKHMAKLDARADSELSPSSTSSVAASLPDAVFGLVRDLLDALIKNRDHPRREQLKVMRALATSAPNLRVRSNSSKRPVSPRAQSAAAAPSPATVTKPSRRKTEATADPMDLWLVDSADVVRGEEIGAGAHGRVRRGRWRGLDVAIKELVNTRDPRDVKRFMQEMRLLCCLRPHRHVVTLYAVVSEPPAIVMEECNKGSLDVWLTTPAGAAAAPAELLRVLDGVARGVSHLHAELVVHGDLAARNVLLSDDGTAKVCDFGFAAAVGGSASSSAPTASATMPLKWLSPERLLGAQVSTQSDVYAFGVVCSEVMNRRPPFADVSNETAARLVVEDGARPAPPSATMGGIDLAWLVLAVRSCWVTEPEARPTMLDLTRVFSQNVANVDSARQIEQRRTATDADADYAALDDDDVFDLEEDTDYVSSASSASASSWCEPRHVSHRSAMLRRQSTRLMMTSSSSSGVMSRLLDTPEKRIFLLDFIASERVPADIVFLWRVRLFELIPPQDANARLADFRAIVAGPLREVSLSVDVVADIEDAMATALAQRAPPRVDVFERARAAVIASQSAHASSAVMASAFASAVLSATIGSELQLASQLLDQFQAEGELLSVVGLKVGGAAAGADWQVLRHGDDTIVSAKHESSGVFSAKATSVIRRDLASVVRYVSSLSTRGEWDTGFVEGRVVCDFGPFAVWWTAHRAPGAIGALMKKRDCVQMRVIISRDANTTLLLARSITHRAVAAKVANHLRFDLGLSGFICQFRPDLQATVVTSVVMINQADVPSYVLRQFALQRGDMLANVRVALQVPSDDVAPLHAKWFDAAKTGHLATLKELLKACPSALVLRDRKSQLALHLAAIAGHTDVVRWLASRKRAPSLDVRDAVGFTPLCCAAANGCVETCLALLDLGADCGVCNAGKSTPLHYAARVATWSQPLRSLLERLTASPTALSARDASGATPLHMACFKSGPDVCSLLIERGANVHAVDQRSESALHYAVRANKFEVVELLLLNGADLRAINDLGETPYDVSIAANASASIRRRVQV